MMHSPAHAEEAAEARRLGGSRRRRETALSVAFDVDEEGGVERPLRVLDIAIVDTLALENSVARNRTLAYLCHVYLKAKDMYELEQRIRTLEEALGANHSSPGVRVLS